MLLNRWIRTTFEICGKQLAGRSAHVHTAPKAPWILPPIRTTVTSPPPLRPLSIAFIRTCSSSPGLFTISRLNASLLGAASRNSHTVNQTRNIVRYSWHSGRRTVVRCGKRGKRKTCKAVAKRFRRTGSGNLKYWPAGKSHRMLVKSRKRRLQLRKKRYTTKVQLKTLNKMLPGY